MEGYPVPQAEATAEIRVKNSRFIGLVGPADSPQQARAYLAELRSQHPQAAHCVYAFAIGYGASVVHGMSDDGEPSGTAGRPVLAVLRGADLGDAVVAVLRYFGGTKLGTGGLVKAYTQAAQAAIEAVKRRQKVETTELGLEMPYEWYERCQLGIAACGGQIIAEDFSDRVRLRVRLGVGRVEELQVDLTEMSRGKVGFET